MRILLDLQACQASSMHRGIGRYSMALALAMARNSGAHDLRIVLNQDYPDSVATLRQAFDGLVPQSHITTFAVPVPAGEVDPRNAWRVRAAERVREHYLASLRPDIVHVASLFEGLGDNSVASVLHGEGGFDTAVTLYDLIPLMRKERYLGDPNVAAWYHRKLESLQKAELLLAISASAREEAIGLLELPPVRVVNISSAVDAIFRPRELDAAARTALLGRYGLTRPFIMYTGGIDYRKNIEGLLEAYAALPAALRRQYQLAVVCSIQNPDRFRLQRLASSLGLAGDDLVLTGFVPDDDLVSLYNCTSLFVFPSLHEGFGLPALEAMACGAPVIGSNTSSIPEVIGRADALFDPNNVADISASMGRVLGDPARQAELRAHGAIQATRFSWDASARRAFAAFEELHARRGASGGVATARPTPSNASRLPKPRLAFVSPLPPERSGIANYSADLLPELARHYDIELVVAQEGVALPASLDALPRRSVDWFEQHGHEFDRIVYQFGNSHFHTHMFGLLERHPGVVVLHDFFLSGVTSTGEGEHPLPNNYCRTLYLSHGYRALIEEKAEGRTASCDAYPCNKAVLERATGVIVHSAHAVALARHWYGPGQAQDWRVLPLLRTVPAQVDKAAARRELDFGDDDFVLCSFGLLAPTKCNDRAIETWIDSTLGQDPHCHLVFVGDAGPGRFRVALRERIAAHPRIRITGYVDDAAYRRYLAAADAAVQLRSGSRGETSAGVLDCLSFGLPTIVNAHGSGAEVPHAACLRLDDAFSDADLKLAFERLRADSALRTLLGATAHAYMGQVHAPAHVGELYRDAIEEFELASLAAAHGRLIAALAASSSETPLPDLLQTAAAIAANRPAQAGRQLLVDVGALGGAQPGPAAHGTLLTDLIARAPAGWRVEPVRHDGTHYRYARRFTLDLIGRADLLLEDAVAEVHFGDVLLALEGDAAVPPKWSARGVTGMRLEADLAEAGGKNGAERVAQALSAIP
jgi:glycosyltransferase involved in cell wall biosynthesis